MQNILCKKASLFRAQTLCKRLTSYTNNPSNWRSAAGFSRCQDCSYFRNEGVRYYSNHLDSEVRTASEKFLTAGVLPSTSLLQELCKSPRNGFRFFVPSNAKSQVQRGGGQQSSGQENENPNDNPNNWHGALVTLGMVAFTIYIFSKLQSAVDQGPQRFVSWNEFVHEMLARGEVEELIVMPEREVAYVRLHRGAVIKNRRVDDIYNIFTLKISDVNKFEEKLRKAEEDLGIRADQGVPVSYSRNNGLGAFILLGLIALSVFFAMRRGGGAQAAGAAKPKEGGSSGGMGGGGMFDNPMGDITKAKFRRADLEKTAGNISFKDVAGLHEAKTEILEFVDYLKRPDRYKTLGAKIPHGALLLGPPGCGKTLLAKALATEAGVPFLVMAGSEFVEMIGGLGASRVRNLFKEAREKAPCIIYIDEIDAIGRKRTSGSGGSATGNSEEEHTLNQLLVEMDGMDTVEGVIMLASTNRSQVLDKALLRAGRFDRHIMIDLPTLAERKETFEMYLGKLATMRPPSSYSERLAQLSPGMSGADIANICNEAALHAARDKKSAITDEDFEYAIERVVAGVAKKSRVLSLAEKRVVAFHEAGHAVVGWMLEHTDALLKVSIVPRTSAALGFAQYMPKDQHLFSKEQIFERMCMALGGRVAESITFNRITSGAQDDLKKVTEMAYKCVRELGMSDSVGHISFPESEGGQFAGKPYSKALSQLIDNEVQQLVAKAYHDTEQLMTANRDKLKMIAEALLEKETLNYADVEALIGPRPYHATQF